MCGLSGVILPKDKIVETSLLEKMGQTIQHRGPDNFATLVDRNAGFAHNRLSILDVSEAGNQPFANERYVLVYNGEIYNYLDIKKDLLAPDTPFTSTSDTEVLFHSLIQLGVEQTLKNLRGMFAFAFYDRQEGTLYLCRDRLGIKPLFWTEHSGGLYFGSEVKAIAAAVPVSPDPLRTLYAVFLTADTWSGTSLFKDIYAIEPGTYLRYRAGESPRNIPYFQLADLIDEQSYRSMERMKMPELRELFLETLSKSIGSMLMSDVPMGIFVSGGLDSNLVTALANQHSRELNLFTANVIGEITEYPDAAFLAKTVDLPLHDYKFYPEMLIRDWVEFTRYTELPILRYPSTIPFGNVARLARSQGVKPVLTGEGADELFLGYKGEAIQRYRKLLLAPINLVQKMYKVVPRLHKHLFLDPLGYQSDYLRQMIGSGQRLATFRKQIYPALSFLSPKEQGRQFDTLNLLRTNIYGLLHRNDRMGMLASIESRFPFLDEDMLRLGVNLPSRWKHRWVPKVHDRLHPFLMDKYILRKGAEQYLPARLTSKVKKPFPVYGLNNLKIKPGFFQDGYLSELMGLTQPSTRDVIDETLPYFGGRLAAIEIFGRMFGWHQSREEIEMDVQAHITMPIKPGEGKTAW
jgi:asparagine synthase (glutamine-hydrolysing)